jgi:IS5 family transposase
LNRGKKLSSFVAKHKELNMNNYAKRNWTEYSRNLVNRGSITFWLNKECLDNWISKTTKPGRPAFSKEVILAGLIIKTVYNLPLRALQGFFQSILRLLQQDLKVPHYSLFCKRAKEASSCLPKLSKKRPVEILIDSSGLKVRGEGEWKVKIHGNEKRRGWIKLHIAVDPKTQELIAIEVTDDKVADCTILPKLIDKAPKTVQKVFADGAYDRSSCRKYLFDKGLHGCIPPRRHGKIRDEVELESRNDSLKIIRNLGNDEQAFSIWKKLVGYHKRSLVETAFSRLKRHFGERLSNKTTSNLEAEVTFRCHVLNRMNLA